MDQIDVLLKLFKIVKKNGYKVDLGGVPLDKLIEFKVYYKFIFDHDFQKALWGDVWTDQFGEPLVMNKDKFYVDMNKYMVAWQRNAQQLAISDDYIKYLEQFIK